MQRNVLYSRAVTFILGTVCLFLLNACTPLPEEGNTGRPPVADNQTVIAVPAVPAAKQAEQASKAALLVPMTGRGSEIGQAMMNAAQLALFDLGANSFELIPEDTGSSPGFAARDAIGKGAKIILGPLFAADVKDVSPIATQSGVNIISFSTDVSVIGPNTYVLGSLPQSQVNRVLEFAGNKGLNRIALIAPRDAFGDAVASAFDASLAQRSLINGGIIRYDATAPTQAQIDEMTKANVSAVLIAANISQSAAIAQMLSPNIQKLGTSLWENANGLNPASLKGAWYAASSPKMRQKFDAKYRETYGTSAPRVASLAYDAAALAIVLARQGNRFDRKALGNPNGFAGIDGIFRFLPDGQNERGLAVLQVENNSSIVIQEAPDSFK